MDPDIHFQDWRKLYTPINEVSAILNSTLPFGGVFDVYVDLGEAADAAGLRADRADGKACVDAQG